MSCVGPTAAGARRITDTYLTDVTLQPRQLNPGFVGRQSSTIASLALLISLAGPTKQRPKAS